MRNRVNTVFWSRVCAMRHNTHRIDDNWQLIGADFAFAKHGSTGSAASYV